MWEGRAGKGRKGTRGSGIGTVGSRAGGDNRKRVHSAQRRLGLKADHKYGNITKPETIG